MSATAEMKGRKERQRRRAGRGAGAHATDSGGVVRPGMAGGTYRPLSERDMERIHETALDVLERIGIADPMPEVRDLALAKGCRMGGRGRLHFPRAFVEDAIAGAARNFTFHARDPRHDIEMRGSRVHFMNGGSAVSVLDFATGRYRPSTVIDVYDVVRLSDCLEHVHLVFPMLTATDLDDIFEHGISRLYALLSGTEKFLRTIFFDASHMAGAAALCDMVAGGEGAFRKRPFASITTCPVVSPLRFGDDQSAVSIEAARSGFPVSVSIAPQAGATAPAALAGALVQTVAETLAGLIQVNLAVPGHPVIFGLLPFISDLRTGAFSGGGGEEALVSAAAAQMSNFYDLPATVSAGMTDSKLPDNQAGYEKGVATALAGVAGGNIISQAAGMQASLMGVSFEALVIDNEMLGSVLRAVRGIEVTDASLSFDVIAEAALGPGHYLGSAQTLELMETEYLYPRLGDRRSAGEWEEDGATDIRERARERARELLRAHYPDYIDPGLDEKIRELFPIRIPREAMRADCGRW